MNTIAKAAAMDGFDVWFFGGTPGPDDLAHGGLPSETAKPSIDEDDARIPSFAHHCDCGKPPSSHRHPAHARVLACAFS